MTAVRSSVSRCLFLYRDNKNYRLAGLENNGSNKQPPDRGLHSLKADLTRNQTLARSLARSRTHTVTTLVLLVHLQPEPIPPCAASGMSRVIIDF